MAPPCYPLYGNGNGQQQWWQKGSMKGSKQPSVHDLQRQLKQSQLDTQKQIAQVTALLMGKGKGKGHDKGKGKSSGQDKGKGKGKGTMPGPKRFLRNSSARQRLGQSFLFWRTSCARRSNCQNCECGHCTSRQRDGDPQEYRCGNGGTVRSGSDACRHPLNDGPVPRTVDCRSEALSKAKAESHCPGSGKRSSRPDCQTGKQLSGCQEQRVFSSHPQGVQPRASNAQRSTAQSCKARPVKGRTANSVTAQTGNGRKNESECAGPPQRTTGGTGRTNCPVESNPRVQSKGLLGNPEGFRSQTGRGPPGTCGPQSRAGQSGGRGARQESTRSQRTESQTALEDLARHCDVDSSELPTCPDVEETSEIKALESLWHLYAQVSFGKVPALTFDALQLSPSFAHTLVGDQVWNGFWTTKATSVTGGQFIPESLHNYLKYVVQAKGERTIQAAAKETAQQRINAARSLAAERKMAGEPY